MALSFSLAPFRLRLLFRGAFLLLALATVALALYVLREEKQLSYRNYQQGFHKTAAQLAAKLHHPTGQLALLNPQLDAARLQPLRPLLLPYSAIDFDDQNKVQQAVEMAGCQVRYQEGAICAAIGSNPWAGGFIYVAGQFQSGELVAHKLGEERFDGVHRLQISVGLRGQVYRWIAPFEAMDDAGRPGARGRLTGFVEKESGDYAFTRPVKDFRGWLWQEGRCSPEQAGKGCAHRSFFSVRLPVGVLRDDLFRKTQPIWPPNDLDRMAVHLRVLPPGDGPPLLDSDADGASAPFTLSELSPLLLPGETLSLQKHSKDGDTELLKLAGTVEPGTESWRWIAALIRRLDVEGYDQPMQASETIATPLGDYRFVLTGDVRTVNRSLAVVATRVAWFVGAMLLAILLTWLLIEIGIIRRITALTRRAASVSRTVRAAGGLEQLDMADLRGRDELGVLASGLSDLLQRVKEDVERERIRTEQEKDMWHAVGHEIMSPLQSLLALHGSRDDESSRYIHRMQQAVRVLYGSASPSEAFQSTTLQLAALDLDEFLRHVAANAPCVDIADVRYEALGTPVLVRADDYSLEDVVTHVLRNADRFRPEGSAIRLSLEASETAATVQIHNQGPAIPDALIDKIFEYGVSDQADSAAQGNRGQGLFVARTYMAKMGGTITATNVADGVCFTLTLQRAPVGAAVGASL